jgi:hypothetical protein
MGLLDGTGPWLAEQMRLASARTVDEDGEALPAGTLVYRRKAGGEDTDLTGIAWVGRTVFVHRSPTDRGPSVVFGDRDYLIPCSALEHEPEEGDRVIETIGTERLTFELLVTAGEPAWRYSDPARTVYRVHTKEVEREAV